MLHILQQLARDQHNDSEFGKQARDLIRSAEPWPVQRYQTARFRPAKSLDRIVEIQVKYAGYIDRQAKEVERHDHYEYLKLPEALDYLSVKALSIEVRQKLAKHRPETLGQASRIAGVTPAAISLLLVHLKKGGFREVVADSERSDAA